MKMSDDLLEQLTNIRIESKKSLGINSHIMDEALADFDLRLCKFADSHDQLVEALEYMLQANKCKELPSPHWVKSAEAKAKEAIKQAKGG